MSNLFNRLNEITVSEDMPFTLRDGEYKGYKLFRFSDSSEEGVTSHIYIAIKGEPKMANFMGVRDVADKEHPSNPLITGAYQTYDNARHKIEQMIDEKDD